jgi:uncharacterized protein YdeI (YjbR/CyaY-like superfamily)
MPSLFNMRRKGRIGIKNPKSRLKSWSINMNENSMVLEFTCRNDFRTWLIEYHNNPYGIWIVFEKGNTSFTSSDALEEAICFGWIDGVIKSIDGKRYKKYFSQRKDTSKWSDKNRSLFKKLKEQGIMTEYGIAAFQCKTEVSPIHNKADIHIHNIAVLKMALHDDADAHKAFACLAVSRQKQLAGFYCEAKTDETKVKRKAKIIEAVKNNYKGMLY